VENLTIRNADENDIGLIYNLAEKIWKEYYPAIISVEQIEYMLDKMYATASLKQQMLDGDNFLVAYLEDKPVGYISFGNKGEGNYFLSKFYVDAKNHRSGIGQEFFHLVFDELNDLKTIRLTVNRKNFKAINFYFKLGFKIEDVADFDIGNGYVMNDFVMLLKR
jgi:ribosomal protein S18 acetylase RimI-like enzyme